MDTANNLSQILLLEFGILGGILLLLFVMAALDPQTDRRRAAQPKAARSRVRR